MKPFELSDIIYNKEAIENLREQIISLRDAALSAGDFRPTILLSHTIGVLAHVIAEMEE